MSFEEWYDLHKDDISEKVELRLSLKDLFASAYKAGLHADVHTDNSAVIADLEQQIEKKKAELHHRLVSPSHDDSDCLDKIIGLDRLWQFGQEF